MLVPDYHLFFINEKQTLNKPILSCFFSALYIIIYNGFREAIKILQIYSNKRIKYAVFGFLLKMIFFSLPPFLSPLEWYLSVVGAAGGVPIYSASLIFAVCDENFLLQALHLFPQGLSLVMGTCSTCSKGSWCY